MPDLTPPDLTPLDLAQSGHSAALGQLITDSTRIDGQPPFSDQALVDIRSGRRRGFVVGRDGSIAGISIATATAPFEAEFAVSPTSRHQGLGGQLLTGILELADSSVRIWAHGDHPDARALAARHSLVPVRELLQLRLRPVVATGVAADVSPFRPGVDDADWLAVNAAAFASHPEQGGMTQQDLDARIGDPWFDAADFLISRAPDGSLAGFCWLKVEADGDGERIGEFYAVGVAPAAQGTGLGRGLVNAGLARLADQGVRVSSLYVEADNTAAVTLYRSVGFTDHSIDIQYARG